MVPLGTFGHFGLSLDGYDRGDADGNHDENDDDDDGDDDVDDVDDDDGDDDSDDDYERSSVCGALQSVSCL